MLIIVWALALVLLTIFWIMIRSPWGRVLRSIREDEAAAAAVGKNVFGYKLQVLILGALLGGMAGLLLAWQISVFSPTDYEPTFTFYAYLILILGGMTRLWAIPLGAMLFGLLFAGHALPRFLAAVAGRLRSARVPAAGDRRLAADRADGGPTRKACSATGGS